MEYWNPGARVGGESTQYIIDGTTAVNAHNTTATGICEAEYSIEYLGLHSAMLTVARPAIESNFADITRARKKFLEEAYLIMSFMRELRMEAECSPDPFMSLCELSGANPRAGSRCDRKHVDAGGHCIANFALRIRIEI